MQLGLDGAWHDDEFDTVRKRDETKDQLATMRESYGKKDGCICGACRFLSSYTLNNRWHHRCIRWLAVDSKSPDLTMRQQACGLYEKRSEVTVR